ENQPIGSFLEHSITGQFETNKPDELLGPFTNDTLSPKTMQNVTGFEPRHDDYVKSSRMCGTCHTINLPIMDHEPVTAVGPSTPLSMEQATYLEWLNSRYQNEFGPRTAQTRTCQDCHMQGGYTNTKKSIDIPQIQDRIAIIEDETYPEADHRLPDPEITVRKRETGFVRHELLGLNAYLLTFFQQFNEILGVRLPDYSTGSESDLQDAIDNVVQKAGPETATLEQPSATFANGRIIARVKVVNWTGHRFPSGVGFRRAFLEVRAVITKDGKEGTIWGSGVTNQLGVILDGDRKPLKSEFFETVTGPDGQTLQASQPHYQTITRQDQVQIYEELIKNSEGKFTTSFIRRDEEFKDNRLLPIGWSRTGPSASLPLEFLKDTFPKGNAESDPDYNDGSGSDTISYEIPVPSGIDPASVTIKMRLIYQAIPPSYLNQRFTEVPNGPATQRLYYLASNLKVEGTPISGWKLPVASISIPVLRPAAIRSE
ncbi:MAG: hypothetical protein ABIT01_11910, partial [Thermoanaerobaculia bacterium]